MTYIKTHQVNDVKILELSIEEKRNALSYPVMQELSTLLKEIREDTYTRVVVLRGAGEKSFCAGADLKERVNLTQEEVRRNVLATQQLTMLLETLPQPTIAFLNGVALGGGLELALACDFRLAVKEISLGLPETNLAIIPGAGGTQRLPRLIGESLAKEWIYFGKIASAEEALACGLVHRIYTREEAASKVLEFAQELANRAPLAVQQAKRSIIGGRDRRMKDALRVEWMAYESLLDTHDRVEALDAFLGKRSPSFLGK
ncbi:enoyl-CoA hydratase-related protein [Mangrovibacillus cuniculi]|nr:enoyl-CoA hydratase-related protein [Mangrovibacillus cuniculi]